MVRPVRFARVALIVSCGLLALAGTDGLVRATGPVAWDVAIREVDAAITRGDFRGAREAWNHAYAVALAGGEWEGLAAVGDVSATMALATGDPSDLARARQAYHEAFLHARSEGSVDGVLRVSDAYARLGDHETARRHRDVAVRLAVRQTSPGFFARIWARLTGQYVR